MSCGCLRWLVEGEGQTVPPTADPHSAVNQAQSAMVTTPPAPQSQGWDLVQGKPNSNKWLLDKHSLNTVLVFHFQSVLCLHVSKSIPNYFLGRALLVTDASFLALYVWNVFSYWSPSEGPNLQKIQSNMKAYSSLGKVSHSIKLNSFLAWCRD